MKAIVGALFTGLIVAIFAGLFYLIARGLLFLLGMFLNWINPQPQQPENKENDPTIEP